MVRELVIERKSQCRGSWKPLSKNWDRPIAVLTFASLLISRSSKPTFVSGWLVFITARVSEPVRTTNLIAEPAARTVLAQSTFSTFKGETLWGKGWSVTEVEASDNVSGTGRFIVKVPTKVWMSLIGASARAAFSRSLWVVLTDSHHIPLHRAWENPLR